MTMHGGESPRWVATRPSFDVLLNGAGTSRLSFAERDLLVETHWNLGQDARLRDDVRFRATPWGRWIPSEAFLANDALWEQLRLERRPSIEFEGALAALEKVVRRRCVVCPADPRLVVEGAEVRLASRELTDQPLVESSVAPLERYETHLPLHTLRAAAASAPLNEWGQRTQEQVIETLGWVRVTVPGRSLNPRMFVARVEGESGEGWAWKDLPSDDRYAVFELWPSGTKQNQIVLVRGSFSDPETGNYAVKKYVGDQRGPDGRHRTITLVSLHPDKERFPDIVLEDAEDDGVTVVAKFVHSLSPGDFTCRPRPHLRPGRRDVSSAEACAEASSKLASYVERFFETVRPAEPGGPPSTETWTAELVCLDSVSGGLHIEGGPLRGLWSFVKRLRVTGEGFDSSVLASNVRERTVRVSVPPGSGPWSWRAVDFEDDPDVDLSMLEIGPVEADRVRLFRVDAEGVGRELRGDVLSSGQAYRVLVPAGLAAGIPETQDLVTCGPGWFLWEVELPIPTTAAIGEFARQLGLEIGEPVPTVAWAISPPSEWRRNIRGEAYACFDTASGAVAELDNVRVEFEGEAIAFLYGPDGLSSKRLPVGDRHLLRVGALRVGRYVLAVEHHRTAVAPLKVAFEVVEERPNTPRATAELLCGDEVCRFRPGERVAAGSRDLGHKDDALSAESFYLAGPPGWPVRILWNETTEETLSTRNLDEQGRSDGNALLEAARARLSRRPIGDVVLDLAELGTVVLRHDRHPQPEAVRTRMTELVSARGETVERLAGAFSDLVQIWFEPVCAALGFDVEWIPEGLLAEPPEHAAVLRLLHVERQNGRIEREAVRLLVLVERLTPILSADMFAWIDEACARERVRDVLLSDGLLWSGHRKTARLGLDPRDLRIVTGDPDDFVSFLHVASEGV